MKQALNKRRIKLIRKMHSTGLTSEEGDELARLQELAEEHNSDSAIVDPERLAELHARYNEIKRGEKV